MAESKHESVEHSIDRAKYQPGLKTKKIILLISISFVVLGIAAVLGMHYTSQPNFCSSCHQIQPQVVSWSVGPHKDVTCLKCHADPGTTGYIKRKIGGLNEVYEQVTNQVPSKIEAKFNFATCIVCHTGSSEFPTAKNIKLESGALAPKMQHAEILKSNTSCLTCHRNVGHSKQQE